MQIKVLFFGIIKDITTKNSDFLVFDTNITVFELRKLLLERYEKLNEFENFSVAVNEVYAENDTVLNENDIVALIPPVSGG